MFRSTFLLWIWLATLLCPAVQKGAVIEISLLSTEEQTENPIEEHSEKLLGCVPSVVAFFKSDWTYFCPQDRWGIGIPRNVMIGSTGSRAPPPAPIEFPSSGLKV